MRREFLLRYVRSLRINIAITPTDNRCLHGKHPAEAIVKNPPTLCTDYVTDVAKKTQGRCMQNHNKLMHKDAYVIDAGSQHILLRSTATYTILPKRKRGTSSDYALAKTCRLDAHPIVITKKALYIYIIKNRELNAGFFGGHVSNI